MENFNFKKFLAEGKLLKEEITSDVKEYLIDLYNLFSSEGYEEGEEVTDIISREEYGDPEAYDNADMFDKAYNEIKQQGGTVVIEGQPNITFSLKGEDIIMNYTNEGELNEEVEFESASQIQAVINHLIDNDHQDILDMLEKIPEWNELVTQASEI
jgi:hypothetical protein